MLARTRTARIAIAVRRMRARVKYLEDLQNMVPNWYTGPQRRRIEARARVLEARYLS